MLSCNTRRATHEAFARPGVLIQPPTVEATVLHRQLFEVRKRRPSRRNPARERVRLRRRPIENELFERHGHHGQRPCDRAIVGISDLVADVVIPPIEENTDKVRTSQRAVRQVERRDVAELADRARQCEAFVAVEVDVAAVDLHADECERQLTWRK